MKKFDKKGGKPKKQGKGKKLHATPSDPKLGTRLNKYVANSGICARRKADEFIQQGVVTVNDKVITAPGHRVFEKDIVKFKGKKIQPLVDYIYILLNKPKGVITSVTDDRGRDTVIDLIGDAIKERIYPVGRLDMDTTGLLLLTNDGDLAKKLSHPSYEVKKVYHVVLNKELSEKDLEKIKKGLELEDGSAPVDGISYIKGRGKNQVGIELHIGRNRIVRRIFKHLGYKVIRLDRTYYAGLNKKDIPRGRFRKLSEKEVIFLKHFT